MDVKSLAGSNFEGWNIEHEIGRGADGIVYLVSNGDSNRALKLFFRESLEKNGAEEQIERLDLQLSLSGAKHHDNLVEVFEGGYSPELETIYIFMEYVEGITLDKLIGKIPSHSIFPLISQLASAARFLESRNLFHRDIKPANIIVKKDFTHLCLLDLGIIHQTPDSAQDDRRLSGEEFVASLRYSPPEFVWREEQSVDSEAWRAITFYQIGAVMYDMIEGKNIFSGHDTPRAHLYDCVKFRTPLFESKSIESWLINLSQSCLIKAWRSRLELVNWDRFEGPPPETDSSDKRISIRLKQLHADETRKLNEQRKPSPSKLTALWEMKEQLFSEIREYLLKDQIFPRFSHSQISPFETEHQIDFEFEVDPARSFNEPLHFQVTLSYAQDHQQSLTVAIVAKTESKILSRNSWTETLSTEKAFQVCEIALLDAADSIVSSN